MIPPASAEFRTIAGAAELLAAQELRLRVFCEEQGVDPGAEIDGLDGSSIHLVGLIDGTLVATCRLRDVGEGTIKLERMAVEGVARGNGVGRDLMGAAEHVAATEIGASRIVLHAQRRAEGFYADCGFVADGPTFDEEGIPHVRMEKPLRPGGDSPDRDGAHGDRRSA